MTKNTNLDEIGFEKIMIWYDKPSIEILKSGVSQTIRLANKVASEYEKLNIGKFTHQIFIDIIEHGLLSIRETYLSALKAEMKRLNIVNPTLRDSMVSCAKSALDPLREAINKFNRVIGGTFHYYSLFKEDGILTFENHRYSITEENLENITDRFCKVHIVTNEQKQVFDNLQKVVNAYNTLVLSLEKINPDNAKLFKESAGNLLDYVGEVDGKLTVYKPNLNNLIYQPEANLV